MQFKGNLSNFNYLLFAKHLLLCVSISWIELNFGYIGIIVASALYTVSESEDVRSAVRINKFVQENQRTSLQQHRPRLLSESPGDTEDATWLNQLLQYVWPYVCHYVNDYTQYVIQPHMKHDHAYSKYVAFFLERVNLGEASPTISDIRVQKQEKYIRIEAKIEYDGESTFEVSAAKTERKSIKIFDFQMQGEITIDLGPLVKGVPLVEEVGICFTSLPLLHITPKGAVTWVFWDVVRHKMAETLTKHSKHLVHPNYYRLPLIRKPKK